MFLLSAMFVLFINSSFGMTNTYFAMVLWLLTLNQESSDKILS
jgi:hypothetical protein